MISALRRPRFTEHKRAEEAIKQSEQRSLEAAEVLREVIATRAGFWPCFRMNCAIHSRP